MSTTFLLDLDNTLLGNDMAHFLPPYFHLLAQRFRPYLQGRALQPLMIASVQAVYMNQDPAVSNFAAFMAHFSQQFDSPLTELVAVLQAFYREDYPQLQQYTIFRPIATELMRYLLAEGHKVVIATNPVFPQTAIEQRLAWAGLADFNYPLVTTMENSYSCKPHPRYYQDILTAINSIPAESWMVGDDLQNDILPAQELGLKTWWITEDDSPSNNIAPTIEKHGRLENFLAFIQSKKTT